MHGGRFAGIQSSSTYVNIRRPALQICKGSILRWVSQHPPGLHSAVVCRTAQYERLMASDTSDLCRLQLPILQLSERCAITEAFYHPLKNFLLSLFRDIWVAQAQQLFFFESTCATSIRFED